MIQNIMLNNSILLDPFFYLSTILLVSTILIFGKFLLLIKKKNKEISTIQQQHTDKVDSIRKEQSDTLNKIRSEMLKREDDRNRQWIESEKETLNVLNGISHLLDLYYTLDGVNTDKILKKLEEIQDKMKKIIDK